MKLDFSKSARVVIAERHESEGIRVLSNLYWCALLVIFFLIIVAVLSYGVLGILRILRDSNETANVSAPPPPALNRSTLEGVVQGFEDRQSYFNLLKTTRGKVISDPSR